MTTDTRPIIKTADRAPKGSATKSTGRKKSLKDGLQTLIGSVGIGVAIINQADGTAVISGAEGLATALDKLAKENDSVYRTLSKLIEVSVWGEVLAATGAIVMPILDNHGLLPSIGGKLEVPSPEDFNPHGVRVPVEDLTKGSNEPSTL